MKITHKFAELTPEKRPQDLHLDGTGIRFETMEHGGEYPDTMPQAIKLIDADRRSCIYVPITQDGKVVDSQGYTIDPEDEWSLARADRSSARYSPAELKISIARNNGRAPLQSPLG